MKKLNIFYFLIAAMLLITTSCGQKNDPELQKMVEQMNASCPVALGNTGELVSTTYDNNIVTFNYSLKGIDGLKDFQENKTMYHDMMLESYRGNADDSFKAIIEAIVKANAKLNVMFRCSNGQEYSLMFTTEELEKNKPGSDNDPDNYLNAFVQAGRMQLPQQFSQGMVGTDMVLDNEYLTYLFECDEAVFNMGEMKHSAVENHDNMKEMMLSSTDPNTVKMLDMLRQSHRGIRYVYHGTTTGTEAIFAVTPEEMQESKN